MAWRWDGEVQTKDYPVIPDGSAYGGEGNPTRKQNGVWNLASCSMQKGKIWRKIES